MATPLLSTTQMTINSKIKKVYKKFVSFTYYDYQDNDYAIKLEKLHTSKAVMAKVNFSGYMQIYLFKEYKYIDKDNSVNSIMVDSTMRLFRLSSYTIAKKIADIEYAEAYSDYINDEYESDIIEKLITLKEYCKNINLFYKQFRSDKENWSKSAKAKKEYIAMWDDLSNTELLNENISLQDYVIFLKKGYSLNQKKKAKVDYLLSLNLQNITNSSISGQIIETSSLFI